MDRCALFLDGGYVYAEGGKLCCDDRARRRVLLDVGGLIERTRVVAKESCGLPVLRTYWYDGAKNGVATTSQQLVAALPNVKLRLGRLNARMQQKGVDALIYRDLMTLTRERAISEAFVVSGDEDLREGVRAAQDMGARVTVVGIAPSGQEFNQSRELVNEADEVRVLTKPDLAPYFVKRELPPTSQAFSSADPLSEVKAAARVFAESWGEQASSSERSTLHGGRPNIPQPLDSDLIQSVEHRLGGTLHEHESLRRAARRTFWEALPPPPSTASTS